MRKSKSILDLFDRQDTSRIVMIPSSKSVRHATSRG